MNSSAAQNENNFSRLSQRARIPAYHVREAARLAGVTVSTVRNWQHKTARDTQAISSRDERESLSFLQLAELRIVAAMRAAGVSLKKIRLAREYLSKELDSEFPFADERVKTDGQDVILELDKEEHLDIASHLLVANKGGQYTWKTIIGEKFQEFDYIRSIALRWRIKRKGASIVVDPMVAFGKPSVRGVPTWVLVGRSRSGESRREIAKDFKLTIPQVSAALEFESLASMKGQRPPTARLH